MTDYHKEQLQSLIQDIEAIVRIINIYDYNFGNEQICSFLTDFSTVVKNVLDDEA